MSLFFISVCAFLASLLTLFSGFGLGTLLMPVVAVFFPVPVAIALTGVVHLASSLFKLVLLRKHIHWGVTLRFGLPAIAAAIPGAWLLGYLALLPSIATYSFGGISGTIEPVKLAIGILLIIFGTVEWHGLGKGSFFSQKWLPIGGILSGFFGGLSGQQGAFRSGFLLHAGLNKDQFVGTNAAIAALVDISRLAVYSVAFTTLLDLQLQPALVISAIVAAFLGVVVGVLWLRKVTLLWIQRLVAALLYILGSLLALGII